MAENFEDGELEDGECDEDPSQMASIDSKSPPRQQSGIQTAAVVKVSNGDETLFEQESPSKHADEDERKRRKRKHKHKKEKREKRTKEKERRKGAHRQSEEKHNSMSPESRSFTANKSGRELVSYQSPEYGSDGYAENRDYNEADPRDPYADMYNYSEEEGEQNTWNKGQTDEREGKGLRDLVDEDEVDISYAASENRDLFRQQQGPPGSGRGKRRARNDRYFANKREKERQDRSRRPRDRKQDDDRPICKYFHDGRCIKGNRCQFSHEAPEQKRPDVCKYYMHGFCQKGDQCFFMHSEFPCRFFHTGQRCFKGDDCKFSHGPLTDETRPIIERAKQRLQSNRRDFHEEEAFGGYEDEYVGPEAKRRRSEEVEHEVDEERKPSLLGSPPRHVKEEMARNERQRDNNIRAIPSLLNIHVEPPPRSNSPMGLDGPNAEQSNENNSGAGFYRDTSDQQSESPTRDKPADYTQPPPSTSDNSSSSQAPPPVPNSSQPQQQPQFSQAPPGMMPPGGHRAPMMRPIGPVHIPHQGPGPMSNLPFQRMPPHMVMHGMPPHGPPHGQPPHPPHQGPPMPGPPHHPPHGPPQGHGPHQGPPSGHMGQGPPPGHQSQGPPQPPGQRMPFMGINVPPPGMLPHPGTSTGFENVEPSVITQLIESLSKSVSSQEQAQQIGPVLQQLRQQQQLNSAKHNDGKSPPPSIDQPAEQTAAKSDTDKQITGDTELSQEAILAMLPPAQRDLFLRLRRQEKEQEAKAEADAKQAVAADSGWYSDDDEKKTSDKPSSQNISNVDDMLAALRASANIPVPGQSPSNQKTPQQSDESPQPPKLSSKPSDPRLANQRSRDPRLAAARPSDPRDPRMRPAPQPTTPAPSRDAPNMPALPPLPDPRHIGKPKNAIVVVGRYGGLPVVQLTLEPRSTALPPHVDPSDIRHSTDPRVLRFVNRQKELGLKLQPSKQTPSVLDMLGLSQPNFNRQSSIPSSTNHQTNSTNRSPPPVSRSYSQASEPRKQRRPSRSPSPPKLELAVPVTLPSADALVDSLRGEKRIQQIISSRPKTDEPRLAYSDPRFRRKAKTPQSPAITNSTASPLSNIKPLDSQSPTLAATPSSRKSPPLPSYAPQLQPVHNYAPQTSTAGFSSVNNSYAPYAPGQSAPALSSAPTIDYSPQQMSKTSPVSYTPDSKSSVNYAPDSRSSPKYAIDESQSSYAPDAKQSPERKPSPVDYAPVLARNVDYAPKLSTVNDYTPKQSTAVDFTPASFDSKPAVEFENTTVDYTPDVKISPVNYAPETSNSPVPTYGEFNSGSPVPETDKTEAPPLELQKSLQAMFQQNDCSV